MRRFLTIGIKPDGAVKILQGADVDRADHRAEFRKLIFENKKSKKSEFAEVQVIDLSRGVISRKRYGGLKDAVTGKRTVARTVKPQKRTVARTGSRKTGKKTVDTSAKKAERRARAQGQPDRQAKAEKPAAKSDKGTFPKKDESDKGPSL